MSPVNHLQNLNKSEAFNLSKNLKERPKSNNKSPLHVPEQQNILDRNQ